MRNTSAYSRRVGFAREREEEGVWFNHLARGLHCRKIPPIQQPRRAMHTVERKDCGPFAMLEEGKRRNRDRTRSSADPIKKLLRYWRLNVVSSSRHVPIFFLCSPFSVFLEDPFSSSIPPLSVSFSHFA